MIKLITILFLMLIGYSAFGQGEVDTTESQLELWNKLDKLNDEIFLQKARLEAQRAQIKKQQVQLNSQKGDLNARKVELEQKVQEIERQKLELAELQTRIFKQGSEARRMSESLVQKEELIKDRKRRLLLQRNRLKEQDLRIEEQTSAINEQKEKLSTTWEKLRSQGLLIYILTALILLVGVSIFFAMREYRRKRRSEKEVKSQNEKLVELNDSLDSFVYRVSHDLKAPVVNVKNMIGMLKDHTKEVGDPMVPKIIENLDLSSNRLESTITDLLELNRIERIEEKKEQIRIKDVAHSIVPEYQNEIETIGGKIEMSFHDNGTYSSFTEMESVFQNLLTNSIKYRRKDVPLKIVISTREENGEMLLDYSDNGIGIDLEHFKSKIFGMFQRFTSDTEITGTGVGMYIIKRLVDKNRGRIELQSEPGKGLRYLITLPAN